MERIMMELNKIRKVFTRKYKFFADKLFYQMVKKNGFKKTLDIYSDYREMKHWGHNEKDYTEFVRVRNKYLRFCINTKPYSFSLTYNDVTLYYLNEKKHEFENTFLEVWKGL